MEKSKRPFLKSKRPFLKSKRPFLKSKRSFRRRLTPIQPGDRIDYRNLSLLWRFISQRGKILSRRVTRLTLKQQRLITIAIKQARILSLLPFINTEKQFKKKQFKKKQFEKTKPTARTTGLRTGNQKKIEKTKPTARTTGLRTGNQKKK